MLRMLLGVILTLVLVVVLGNILLEEFPQLQPLWDEFSMHVVNLYNMAIVNYGTVTTIVIIVAIILLIGTSSRRF